GRRLLDSETERRILDDLIVAGCTDMEHWDSLSNKGTAVFALSAAVGRLLMQPERVRHALDGFNRMLENRYHHDGFYSESPAYAAHNLSNISELPELLHGYSDPPGYRPEAGPRLDNLAPFTTGRYHLALQAMMRMLVPGNRLPVIGDTVYDTGPSIPCLEALAAHMGGHYAGLLEIVQGAGLSEKGSEYALWYRPADLRFEGPVELPLRSEWFPGWHVGILRGGRKANDTALCLNGNEHHWTLQTGHRQRDILSLSYYAYGEELVSDRGYFSGSSQLLPDGRSGQSWVRSTLSHNLVVVDEEDQADRGCGSNLELFGTAPGIEVVQASGFNAYPQCEDYRRTCVLVQAPEGQTYAVDFFRVRGGRTHQYSFHCNGSPATWEPGKPTLQPVDVGPTWGMWLSNPRAFTPEAPCTFTWQFRNVGLDLILLNTGDTLDRVVLADAPGWRRASPAELEKPPIRQVLAENRSRNPDVALATQYAAVIVPYRAAGSPVLSARLIENDADSGVLAVEVALAGRTDRIISTPDQQQRQYGPVTAAGQFAFVSVDDRGCAVQGYLLNGARLACGDLQIALPEPNTTLKVRSVADRTFHLAEPQPSPPAARGSYLLVGEDPRTGFEVESAEADAITVRDYPAIACDEVTVLNARWWRALSDGRP
ncbi:MAG: heparinase II/III family protein, partial [Acidobacteriota bacterium]